MGKLNGILISEITPWDDTDVFPTHDPLYGIGGWREVNSIAERDAIPSPRLREGMVVHVIGDQSYQYLSSAWVSFGSAGPGQSSGQTVGTGPSFTVNGTFVGGGV